MECKVFACLYFFIVLVGGKEVIDVQMDSTWKPDIGWIITCRWKLVDNDTLQSVRLYDNERQFMIYRPEANGETRSQVFRRPEDMMLVECTKGNARGVEGACVLTIELYQPMTKDFTYSCEVSGERPKFMMRKENLLINAFVPPTDAVFQAGPINVDSGRVVLNCTSSGLPAPQLVWQIGQQKVPSDFTGTFWNATSKLWHVWSVLSYTYSDEHSAICIPEISKDGKITIGASASYSSAERIKDITNMVFTAVMFILLLR
ncbi:unnamed protein product [Arctia plantaginis]|uniref:Ig-like domain-containing protein n=1 Tax=Arctia plantaginis TaxID=874455 RepID=A0A8S1ALX2_ARCPL|nr:unnamed protein product [Arctia plantaginis]